MRENLGMGIYFDREKGQIEVDSVELLRFANWEDTPQNRDQVTIIAMQAFNQVFPNATGTVVMTDPGETAEALKNAGLNADIIIKPNP